MKCGLQLLCIEAIMCGKIAYHEYKGAPVILDEADEIRHSLGPFSKVRFFLLSTPTRKCLCRMLLCVIMKLYVSVHNWY